MALVLSLIGCGAFGSEYGEDVLPTEDQLAINLPLASDSAKAAGGGTEWAPFYDTTRNVTETVNGMITFVLGTVGYVTTLRPSWVDDGKTKAMWGPYSDSGLDPVETGLYVQKEEDGRYTWAIFQLPNGGDVETDAVDIVVGEVDAGSTRTDAAGVFVVDFTTANGLDPAQNLVGQFAVEYDYDDLGVAAVASFTDYGWESGQRWDASYVYNEDYAGAGWMDVAWLEDVNHNGTDELVALRSRWQADGQGRGDAYATAGDTVVHASNCWGSGFTTVYWADDFDWRSGEGEEAACAFTPAEYAEEADFSVDAE